MQQYRKVDSRRKIYKKCLAKNDKMFFGKLYNEIFMKQDDIVYQRVQHCKRYYCRIDAKCVKLNLLYKEFSENS